MVHNILMNGEYVFYENGIEIHREKNLITKFGKRFLTGYLAGHSSFTQKDIAVGIGTTAASVDDNQLEFEFYRSAVFLSSTDIQTDSLTGESTYSVVYKTTLPVDVDGIITEVGLFPSVTAGNTDFSSRFITSFENPNSWTDSDGNLPETVNTPDPRIGQSLFQISALSGAEKEYWFTTSFDVSGYSDKDSLSLAFRQADVNLDYAFIRFYNSDTAYYEIQFPGSTVGDKLVKLTMDNLFNNLIGTPESSEVIKISAGIKAKSTGAATAYFDGLRINDEDSYNPQYGLISRSVLDTPITKVVGRQMDIEYRLGLSL